MAGIRHELEIEDKGFIFDPEEGHTYNINPSGLFVIKELTTGTSTSKIVDLLCDKFGISQRTASLDLNDFLRQLSLLELIESGEVLGFD
jgi:hypothetical protein